MDPEGEPRSCGKGKVSGGFMGVGFGGEAFGHDGLVEALLQGRLELKNLVIAINADGLAGGVDDDFAVVALAEVLLDFDKQLLFDLAIEVVGQLAEKVGAVHGFTSDLCRK
jgi:hypothetical protein